MLNVFVHGDAAHLEGGQQSGYLCIRIPAVADVQQQDAGFFCGQLFVVEDSIEYLFHCMCAMLNDNLSQPILHDLRSQRGQHRFRVEL